MANMLWDIRFIKYILVGATSTIVDIALLALILHFTDFYQTAIFFSFVVGFVVNHFLHSRYTFQVESHSLAQVIRFLVVVALNYGVTVLAIFVMHEIFGAPVIIAKIISLPLIAVIGFLLSKNWAFTSTSG